MFIVIKRKILLFLMILLFLIIFIILYNIIFKHFLLIKNIAVSSTPVSNHVVILDAGHGMPDGGAVGTNGSIESELNLEIVLKLQKLLEASNCIVILTRSDENGIYDTDANTIREKKVSDMKNRVKIANNSNAEIFISIHLNKLEQENVSGWQTFYKNDDKISKELAYKIQKDLDYFMKKNNKKEVKSISNIYLTKNVEIPLVLIECGFLSNNLENELLQNDTYQDKLVWSIYTGIMDFFANK